MANFSERIRVTIDLVADKASKGLKDFRSSVGEAEGFTGKLKAGVGSLTGALGSTGVAGAATAAAGAAFKMASDFSDLGVEVGKFSDATGLSNEQASRWIEVAGDLGIESGALEGILGKLNKNIDPKLFKEYGIEIAHASDGTVDANQTFLNTLDVLNKMKDPAERAKVAAKLLGRSWQGAAELIGMSSKDIKARLDGVGNAQVFNDEKVAKARKFRDAMDDLTDSAKQIALTIGESVTPALSEMATSVSDLTGPLTKLVKAGSQSGGVKQITDGLAGLGDLADQFNSQNLDELMNKVALAMQNTKVASSELDRYLSQLNESHARAVSAAKENAAATEREKDATKKFSKALADLNDIQKEFLGIREDVVTQSIELMTAQAEYNTNLAEGTTSTADLAMQAKDLANKQADLAAQQDKANGKTQTAAEKADIMRGKYKELQKSLEPGSPLYQAIQAYIDALDTIPTNIRTSLSIVDPSGRPVASTSGAGAFGLGPDGARAGRSVEGGSWTTVVKLNDTELTRITTRADQLRRGTR